MYFLIIVCRDQARVSHNKHTRKKYDWNVATQANAAKNHFLQRHFSISFVFCFFFVLCVSLCLFNGLNSMQKRRRRCCFLLRFCFFLFKFTSFHWFFAFCTLAYLDHFDDGTRKKPSRKIKPQNGKPIVEEKKLKMFAKCVFYFFNCIAADGEFVLTENANKKVNAKNWIVELARTVAATQSSALCECLFRPLSNPERD